MSWWAHAGHVQHLRGADEHPLIPWALLPASRRKAGDPTPRDQVTVWRSGTSDAKNRLDDTDVPKAMREWFTHCGGHGGSVDRAGDPMPMIEAYVWLIDPMGDGMIEGSVVATYCNTVHGFGCGA